MASTIIDSKPFQCLHSAKQTELLNVVDELHVNGFLSDFIVDRLRRPIQWKEFSPSGHFRLGLPKQR